MLGATITFLKNYGKAMNASPIPGSLDNAQRSYDPNRLLDALIDALHLKNDAALSRALEVPPPVISKIRHHKLPVGAAMLIRMHEVTEISIRDLRYLMGDRRQKFRLSQAHFRPKARG